MNLVENSNDLKKSNPKKKIDYSRVGTLLIGLFLNNFVFFGIIGAKYGENPIDNRLIWYYQFFFSTYDNLTMMRFWDYGGMILSLFLIGFFWTSREEISLYGIKYTMYFLPITTINSILWYWFNTGNLGQGLLLLFGHLEGYLTIFLTLIILGFGSFVGLKFKQYGLYKRDIIELSSNIKSD